uniref:Centrosomal protein of 68 kDa n=1 Tax=Salvator merianae TaxID=96440 RepID=A0A8D0BFF2_SALMN
MSSVPSNSFCKIKAKYVERQPLISKTTFSGEVPRSSSTEFLHSEEHQMNLAECSHSTELLHGLTEVPGALSPKIMDSKVYSSATKSLYNLDNACGGQMLFTPYSSTPKHLSVKHHFCLDARTPAILRSNISWQLPEESDFHQQWKTSSKSFSGAGALSSPGTSVPWDLHALPGPGENALLSTPKVMPVERCAAVGLVRAMSPFQADYWACAIPDSLPPSPDRQSPHWNPNKEYEDLLDYTYPLRPKYKLRKTPKDSSIHDSGVDLDSLSISPESTLRSVNEQSQEHQAIGVQNTQSFFTPLKKLECSSLISPYRLSPLGKVSFANGDTLTDISKETARGPDWLVTRDATESQFIRSTSVLPLREGSFSDEEYLSLPPRLKELETLAQQLTDLSLTIRKPEPGCVQEDIPCVGVNGEQLPLDLKEDSVDHESQWETCYTTCHAGDFHEHGNKDLRSDQAKDHEDMPTGTASTGFLHFSGLDFLDEKGCCIKEEKDLCSSSLALHIKKFCYQLEELIHWLQKVAEVTDNWIPPKPDIESVKASLQNYLEFKKDLVGHQSLTEGVLKDGEKLLTCMKSNSPVLQNTLGLIAKQSDDLENYAERLYESIVVAMDALGAGLMKRHNAEQTAPQAKSST